MRAGPGVNPLLLLFLFIVVIAVFSLSQYKDYRWRNYEGSLRPILPGGRGGWPGFSLMQQTLSAYLHWYRVFGTVVDVKVAVFGDEALYYPVFSYTYRGETYLSAPRKGYEANRYPIGTATMLLVPEQNPCDIAVLRDIHNYNPWFWPWFGTIMGSALLMLVIRIMI